MVKHWYAWFNSYGCIATTSFGGGRDNGYVYLAFPTKEARDGWLFTHEGGIYHD